MLARRAMRRSILSCLLVTTAAACTSAEPDHETTGAASSAVLGGAPDTAYAGAVAIFVRPGNEFPDGLFCTGALVAPNVVLTARHCVSPIDVVGEPRCEDSADGTATRPKDPVAAKSVVVVAEPNAYDENDRPASPRTVERIEILPDSTGEILCGHDLALLVLAKPVETTALLSPRLEGPPTVGTKFTAVGYGVDGTKPDSSGIRRSRSGLTVIAVGEVRTSGRLRSTANDWRADMGPCGGDSGSPAIDESGALIGVMSRGPSTRCEGMTYTRVDRFAEWLKTTVREAARDPSDVPTWVGPREAPAVPDAAAAPPSAGDTRPSQPEPSGCGVSGRSPTGAATSFALFLVLAVVAAGRRRARRAS